MAPRPLQTDLSLSLDANVDERQGGVQMVLFQVGGIKNKTQEHLYLYGKSKGVTFLQLSYLLFISLSGILLCKR